MIYLFILKKRVIEDFINKILFILLINYFLGGYIKGSKAPHGGENCGRARGNVPNWNAVAF